MPSQGLTPPQEASARNLITFRTFPAGLICRRSQVKRLKSHKTNKNVFSFKNVNSAAALYDGLQVPAARVCPEPREGVLGVRPSLHQDPPLLVEKKHRERSVQQQPLAGEVRFNLSN